MPEVVGLPGGRTASYEVIGTGRPTLMFAGGPGFSAAYMNGDAELLSEELCSYLIDPHGSGSSTPPADPAGYSPEGHARFYEEVRQALALPDVVVLGHSFGATTALTYAALYPRSTAKCVAVAAFGIGPDADAQQGGEAGAEAETLLARHAGSPWYETARPVMDGWTERLLAATDAAEMEHMMATVLPFYLAEPDKPAVAARLAEMSRVMKANLAAGQAWTSRSTCAPCSAVSHVPPSSWPASLTSFAAPPRLSRSPAPSPDPSWSCFPAAATYPASKHPRNTGTQSGNSSATEAWQFSCPISPIPHIPRAQAVARPDNRRDNIRSCRWEREELPRDLRQGSLARRPSAVPGNNDRLRGSSR